MLSLACLVHVVGICPKLHGLYILDDNPLIYQAAVITVIGVRSNIHLGGGQTEFCPNGFGGAGVVAYIFRARFGGGGSGKFVSVNFSNIP